jgi:hypothetical protein
MLMWMAITAACVSLGAAVVAGAAIVQVGNQAERAESTAAEQCWRSRTLAAFAIEDFADRGVYPPILLPYARRSVPKTCPPIDASKMPPRDVLDATPAP